jgi:hypothetical protein
MKQLTNEEMIKRLNETGDYLKKKGLMPKMPFKITGVKKGYGKIKM